ncbi:hypothetical protein ID866_10108 [Astraeus odoratus]|nr:hypothetical protein ID866_10108 [Astraeus odoratus]
MDTTEVKNGESIAYLRKMVLGMIPYQSSDTVPGKYLALDCEMVGIGLEGSESSLARVSIVNFKGAVVLDVYVRQRERVVDYRTQWSGVREGDLGEEAQPFNEVQKTVADLIKDRILVGHAIQNDLKALFLSHPASHTRDTQSLAHRHKLVKSRRPALRVLVLQELGIAIQEGEHDSVTDARATMALFRLHKKQWESGFMSLRVPKSKSSVSRVHSESNLSAHTPAQASSPGKRRSISATSHRSSSRNSSPTLSDASSLLPVPKSTAPRDKKPQIVDESTGKRRRSGISSGISTVIRRAGEMKVVAQRGAVGGGKAVDRLKTKEKWWATFGGGPETSKGM